MKTTTITKIFFFMSVACALAGYFAPHQFILAIILLLASIVGLCNDNQSKNI